MAISYSRTCKLYLGLQLLLGCMVSVQGTVRLQVVENSETNSVVGRVHEMSTSNSNYRFTGNCGTYFNINPDSSLITVLDRMTLDREAIVQSTQSASDVLNCIVSFETTSSSVTTTTHIAVDIEVLDENDCTPYFFGLTQPHSADVVENVAVPTPVLRLQPIDDDNGANGTTDFEITGGNDDQYFMIDLAEGDTENSTTNRILFLRRSVNFEDLTNNGVFNLTVTITDRAPSAYRLSFEQTITIHVVNLEDEPPTFEATSYTFNVTENHPVGSQEVFARVLAGSDQSSGQVFYNICSACRHEPEDVITIIGVNQVTGGLFLRVPVDFESLQDPSFLFEVIASNPNTRETVTTSVTVDVLDINEHPPYFVCIVANLPSLNYMCSKSSVNNSEYYIEENSTISHTLLFNFQVKDNDPTNNFKEIDRNTIGFHSEPEYPFIHQFSPFGAETIFFLQLVSGSTFDREETPSFNLTLTVENVVTPRLRTVTTIRIRVLDINDNHPRFAEEKFEGSIVEGSPANMEVVRVEARDPDEGENGTVTYSISDVREEVARDWFQISPETGMISVRDSSTSYLSVGGTVTLTVTATDNGTNHLSTSVMVVISVLPSTTFVSGSYQEYSGTDFNLLAAQSTSFYFEFRSFETDGLLAYQRDPSTGAEFSVALHRGGIVVRSDGEELAYRETDVATDSWHSVHMQLYQSQVANLTVSEVDFSSDASRLLVLRDLAIQRCVNSSQQSLDHRNSLYIGGVNLFTLPPNTTVQTPKFVGGIRNVVVGGVQLDPTCPATEVNIAKGVVRSNGCAQLELSCSANRSSGCVDYAEESYCQCRGFPSAVCSISHTSQEMQSYAPIRFHGSTRAQVNLGYSFFYDLQVQKTPGGSDSAPGTGTGVGGTGDQGGAGPSSRRRREGVRKRNTVESGVSQVVEILFRLVDRRSAVLLHSRTSSSVHLIRIEHNNSEDAISLRYTIWDQDPLEAPLIDLSIDNIPFQDKQYSLQATTSTEGVTLAIPERQVEQEWSDHPMSQFAQQPVTDVSIGGAVGVFNNTDPTFNYFMGCISRVSIDGIELPLGGLLSTTSEEGGFQLEDTEGVENYCDLCDLTICPKQSVCRSDLFGGVECECQDNLVLTSDGNFCEPPVEPVTTGLGTPATSLISYIAGGVGAGVLVLVGVVVIVIIVMVRRRQEKKKKTYSISSSMTNGYSRSTQSNPYTPTTPKRRPSLTAPTTPGCGDERGSSVSTYQEHDGEPESPARHSTGRTRHTSVESGIKMDTDQEASSNRGIPQMDDSGHEVNSTDSARSEESEDIASSYSNEQLPSRPSIAIRIRGGLGSPDQHSPHTPLTPKEQKIMVPLRPASTNLSQSEFGDEVTDTESFNTRVSSSSGAGGSMQNQGRGSDSENSKTSGLQWYKSNTNSDTERESERRPYYPLHSAALQAERGSGRHYQQRFKQAPPTYYSPPTFSDHMNGGAYRQRSKSLHTTVTKSPLTKSPQRYENYPHQFPGDRRETIIDYEHRRPELSYEGHPRPRHERQYSDPRALNDDYNPTPTSSSFSRQYSDPRIPRNGNYCIPRKPSEHPREHPMHARQMSDPRQLSQQTQDSLLVQPRSSRSLRHITSPSAYSNQRPSHGAGGSILKDQRPYYTLGRTIPDHVHFQPGRSFSTSDAVPGDEPFQTLNHISRIDPISNYEAQDRMKIAVDHMDPLAYHLLSGPCMQFEDVSTDPSVIESQLTMDESVMGEQVFESQGGGEGTAEMLDPLDMRLARLREDEIDSILTDSEIGKHVMNHFPSADCSSQYTATIVAGSTSTSGESTPKMQKVFVIPPSQQSFDV